MKIDTVITKDNIEMSYFLFGTGKRALVILPGLSVRSVLFNAKAVENAYKSFAEDYTVYVIDRRRNVPDPYPIRKMAADTAAVMRELGIADADVFGTSQGGMIALHLAADHPELVHALVLGSSIACTNDPILKTCERWIAFAKKRDVVGLTGDFVDHLFSSGTVSRFRDFLIHMNDDVSEEDLDRFIILAEAIAGYDAREAIKHIECPCYVIGAVNDLVVGGDSSSELADLLGCECYLYGAEYGHCVFDEAPDYKERLMAFFQQL